MAAREKLNTVYLLMISGVSTLFGLVTQSFVVFVVSFVLLTVLLMNDETIRPMPTNQLNQRRRG